MNGANSRPYGLSSYNRFSMLPEYHDSTAVYTSAHDNKSIHTQKVQAPEPAWICGGGKNSITIPIRLHTVDTEETSAEMALVDSGATHSFIDREYVQMKGWNPTPL